jgi:glycosyltransferase domain-containing protein
MSTELNFKTPQINLKDLTMIVPTFERPKYVLRQIRYLSSWTARVIIVDGSESPLSPEVLSIIDKLPHIQYVYSKNGYTERISDAVRGISTPFAMCLADDDLYLQSGLIAAIKKLEEDLSAIACMGQSLGLDRALRHSYVFKYGSNLMGYEVGGKSVEERLLFGLNNYRSATPYALFRTDAFKKIWGARENISCLEAVEYENAIRTYIEGRLVTTDSIFWLRSFETEPIPSSIDGSRAIDFSTWYKESIFSGEVVLFEERIVSLLVGSGKFSKVDAKNLYKNITSKILEKSHVTLVDMTKGMLILLYFSRKLGSVAAFSLLKNSYLWASTVRPILNYLLRDKSLYSGSISSEIRAEIYQALVFCNNLHKPILSTNHN